MVVVKEAVLIKFSDCPQKRGFYNIFNKIFINTKEKNAKNCFFIKKIYIFAIVISF